MKSHVRKEDAEELVQKLLELGGYVKSTNGQLDEDEDKRAIMALVYARVLFDLLAGWAVHHQCNAAARAGSDSSVDSSGESEWSGTSADPAVRRAVVARLSQFMPLPLDLRRELCETLEAIEFGEVMALLTPPKRPKSRHGKAYTLWRHRLRAVCHVQFRYGAGEKKRAAEELVANAYGASVDTVAAWEQRLPKTLEPERVKKNLQTAFSQGQQKADMQKRQFADRTARDGIMWLELVHGDQQLVRDGEVYQAALRQGAKAH